MRIRHLQRSSSEKSTRIDLGLALLSYLSKPGCPLTSDDIAAWCDCTGQCIRQLEQRALRHLRNRLNSEDREVFAAFVSERRRAAHPGNHYLIAA